MAHPVLPSGAPAGAALGDPSVLGDLAALGSLPWNLRPEVLLPLIAAAVLYTIGWRRLSRRAAARAPAHRRIALAGTGFVAIGIALVSPLDALAHHLFAAHMAQHMLLIVVAAPALLLADPFPIAVWALPAAARRRLGRRLRRASLWRRLWVEATAMPVAWLAYAATLWLWHLPLAYDAALADRLVHDVEHAAFFLGAVLFWWPVVHPAPRFARAPRHAARITYLVLAAFQTAALGLLLTLAPFVLYRHYALAARSEAFTALDDQVWGGVIMWGLGGLIDMLAVLVLLYRGFGAGGAVALSAAVPRPGSEGSIP